MTETRKIKPLKEYFIHPSEDKMSKIDIFGKDYEVIIINNEYAIVGKGILYPQSTIGEAFLNLWKMKHYLYRA